MDTEEEWGKNFLVKEFNKIDQGTLERETLFEDFKKKYLHLWSQGLRGKMNVSKGEEEFYCMMENATLDKIPRVSISSEKKWRDFFNKLDKEDLFTICCHYLYTNNIPIDAEVIAWEIYLNKFFPPTENEINLYLKFLWFFGLYDNEKIENYLKNTDYKSIARISKTINYYSVCLDNY